MKKNKLLVKTLFTGMILFVCTATNSQMITGVWKGKINRQKAEVKIIQRGDSLTGTSYYYESSTNYRRYSIKGYFDANTNEAVWWDDQLIEERNGKYTTAPGKIPLLSRADFNCPGDGRMMLDGRAGKLQDENPNGDLHLDKIEQGSFADEWTDVINNYLAGGNDPDIIDSVETVAGRPVEKQVAIDEPKPVTIHRDEPVVAKEKPIQVTPVEDPKPQTVEEKFVSRKKTFTKEIPVTGDSIELRFYDNAEIDGDSISLFLNDRLIFEHIRLTEKAYTIKLAVGDLNDSNELTMVAENLGTIPPNTSYMVVMVGENRYDARLESTEGSSAMIRFVKNTKK
jgi:hypothetical protein